MAENKTRETEASVDEYLASAATERRADLDQLVEMMQRLTGCPPKMWGPSIVGFGRYRYRYDSGREGDWFLAGFASRKQSLTLYIMSGFPRHAELMKRLGRYKTGKSCLYIKRLEDVDLEVLEELISRSAEHVKESSVDSQETTS